MITRLPGFGNAPRCGASYGDGAVADSISEITCMDCIRLLVGGRIEAEQRGDGPRDPEARAMFGRKDRTASVEFDLPTIDVVLALARRFDLPKDVLIDVIDSRTGAPVLIESLRFRARVERKVPEDLIQKVL